MKKKQPRLRRALDADNDIRFNQQEIRRLLKQQEEEGNAGPSIGRAAVQAPPKQ